MRPFISIITPCWNREKTIERTIKSVLQQEFKDYEYIIVDGASTDGTLNIIKKYEPLFYGRMHWKSEPDSGLYNAFNKGCTRATGYYTWIVGSDDWIEPNALSVIHDALSKDINHESLLVGRVRFIDDKGNVKSVSPTPTLDSIRKTYNGDGMVSHPSTIVPKIVYERYGYYDEQFKIAADLDWFHRIYSKGVQYICSNSILTNFSETGSSNNFQYKRDLYERVLFLKHKYGKTPRFILSLLKWHFWYFRVRMGIRK